MSSFPMDNISKILSDALYEAFKSIEYYEYFAHLPPRFFNVIYFGKNGVDYTFRSLMGIVKMLEKKKISVKPEIIYEQVVSIMNFPDMIEFELVKNNINFNLLPNFINYYLSRVNLNNIIPKVDGDNVKNILVDFSSPNVAKDMHVGHLRSTIIGENICRYCEEMGHNVLRINHIGDFGLPFGMIIQYMYEVCPNFKERDNISISDLQIFYSESKKRFEKDDKFKEESYKRVVELQSGNPKVIEAWEFLKDISRKSYNEIYERLNVNLEEVGESFYQSMIPDVVGELKAKGILEEDNGRFVIRIPGSKMPLTIIKSDGGFTYDTTDLAAIRYRLVELNVDKIYYVVGSSQSKHFDLIFKAAELAGWKREDQEIRHIGFGLILKEDGKPFKSREGNTIKLVSLLDKSLEKAQSVIETKGTDHLTKKEVDKIVRSIGYSAVKYSDTSVSRMNDYKFSYDNMLSFNGNTAVYMLYSLVRINSILEKMTDLVDVNNLTSNFDAIVTNEYEATLSKLILQFPEVIDRMGKDFNFHILCEYLYNISMAFSKFFTNCRCIHYEEDKKTIKEINHSRLVLCSLTKRIIEKCFYLINIEPLEHM